MYGYGTSCSSAFFGAQATLLWVAGEWFCSFLQIFEQVGAVAALKLPCCGWLGSGFAAFCRYLSRSEQERRSSYLAVSGWGVVLQLFRARRGTMADTHGRPTHTQNLESRSHRPRARCVCVCVCVWVWGRGPISHRGSGFVGHHARAHVCTWIFLAKV